MHLKARKFPTNTLEMAFGQRENAAQCYLIRVTQIIDDNDIVTRFQEFECGMGTDVSQASNDEDVLVLILKIVAVPHCIQTLNSMSFWR